MNKILSIISIPLIGLFMIGCASTQVVTNHHFEPIHVPPHLFQCEVLTKNEIKSDLLINSDVHRIIESVISKNGKCKANINAIRKIVDEHNKTVEELNARKS